MLQFIGITHQYGAHVLFQNFSWHIKPGTKTALIGPNGVGKTTLFKIATQKIKPDKGEVVISKGTQISLFQQIPEFNLKQSVLENLLDQNILYKEYTTKSKIILPKLESIHHSSKEYTELLKEWEEWENYAERHDIHNIPTNARIVLHGLGFSNEAIDKPVGSFSPGYQHRLALAIALMNPHNLLLLDEPTNHLDDSSKEWLVQYLNQTKSSFVLVTHDPEFLNQTTKSISELNSKGVFEFNGSLEEFFEAKEEIQEKLKKQFEKEQAYLKERMEWVERFRAKATKARQVQSVIKKLEKRSKLEVPQENFWNQEFKYNFCYESGSNISFRVESVSFQYPRKNHFIFQNLEMEVSLGDKVALVGPNGAGKSTLLKCLAGLHEFTSGKFIKGPKTKIGYFSQTHEEELDGNCNLLETLLRAYPSMSEQDARTLLGCFAFPRETVYKQTKTLSGGERSRLRLAMLVQKPTNLLLLDEPTNHLDLVIRDSLKSALSNYPGAAVIISHDPEFLSGLCNKTFLLDQGKLTNLNMDFQSYLKSNEKAQGGGIAYSYNKNTQPSTPIHGKELKFSEKEPKALDKTKKNQIRNRIKTLEKEIPLLEKKLELLEKNKRDKEELLSDPEFIKKRSYQSEWDAYKDIKNEIAKVTEQWEIAMNELEELNKIRWEQL